MSTRPASPPPVARWPYFLGDIILLAIAGIALSRGGTPLGIGTIIVAFVCVLLGIALVIAPFLLEYDARLRLAEAAARESNELQARRLAQTAEQLAHAVSRSQSTEEQAGQALGTLEEMAEKLTAHAEELAQTISRAAEREQASQKAEIERLVRERDDALAALDNRVSTVAAALAEVQAATKKAGTANARALDEIKNRLGEITPRLDALASSANATPPVETVVPAEPPPPAAVVSEPPAPEAPAKTNEVPSASTVTTPAEIEQAAEAPVTEVERTKPAHDHAAAEVRAVAATVRTSPKAAPAPKPPAHPELALEGMPAPRPKPPRRDAAGVTSLVATAYIGIGNKLFLRGEGPGLNWDAGVPMQFLAIGKWGWTTTDATAPVTCRIYRNDDTPMLDENIIIAPGAKSELAPRF